MKWLLANQRPLALIAISAVIFAAGGYALRSDPFLRSLWSDGLWTLAALIATWQCFVTARFFGLRRWNAWNAFTLAGASWVFGMLVWSYEELALGRYAPFPSLADIGFLLYPMLMVTGFLMLRTRQKLFNAALWKMGTLVIFLSTVCFLVVIFFFSHLKSHDQTDDIWIAALYPVTYGLAFLYAGFLALHHRKSGLSKVFLLISLSLAAFALTNIPYAAGLITGTYLVGAYFDAFWIVALGLMAWAAFARRRLPVEVQPVAAFGLLGEVVIPVACGITGILVLGVFFGEMDPAAAPFLGFFAIAFLLGNALQKYSLLNSAERRAADAQAASEKLRENETRFRDVAELSADWFWETDMEQRFTYLTGSNVFQGAGLKSEDWLGRTRYEMHRAFTDRSIAEEVQAYMDRGEPFVDIRRRFQHPQAGESWLSISGKPMRDGEGRIVGYRGIGRNVTAQESARRRIQEQERLLRLVIEHVPAAVYLKDLDSRYLLLNHRQKEFLGAADRNLEGLTLREISDEPWVEELLDQDRQVMEARDTLNFETTVTSADGKERHVQVAKFPVFDSEGNFVAIGGINIDITEQQILERQLRQAQKLEAVGNLTGGVAHDFNNLLAVILLNADALKDMLDNQPEALELARNVLSAAEHGAELSRRLLAFSRKQDLKPQVIDVNERIRGFRMLLSRSLGEAIEIKTDLAKDLWPATADPGQLENAILNLAINARDAMPRGGEILIETLNVEIDPDQEIEGADVIPGKFVRVSVTDNGEGMPPEVAEKAFDPFFTTKDEGKGSGLGLSMVYGFLKQSGGWASLYSEPGVGTTIRLYLPRATPEQEASEKPSPNEPQLAQGKEAILVVEDNDLVRNSLVRRLRSLGYQVIEAARGSQALEILGRGVAPDLLLSDMVMPGMHGYELAKEARRIRPGLKVIFTTGFSGIGNSGLPEELGDAKVLHKPYRAAELAKTLREVLEESQ